MLAGNTCFSKVETMDPLKSIVVASLKSFLAVIFLLTVTCIGQDVTDAHVTRESEAIDLIIQVLNDSHVSGSLEYWGNIGCNAKNRQFPAIPAVHRVIPSKSPVETLQRMFQDDPNMRVIEDPSGIVRMVEANVPTDLLNFRIGHLSFDGDESDAEWFHGPNMALLRILSNPEVKDFREAHKIGPLSRSFILPGNAHSSDIPRVTGDLDNVTVSQALDYILKTFPGFWIYANCTASDGQSDRNVFFWFRSGPPTPKLTTSSVGQAMN